MPLQWLVNIATNHDVLVYGLIIILACAEGPILSLLFGVLIRLDLFPLWPVYAALMAGDLVGDVIWYYVGYHFGHRFIRRFGKNFGVTEAGVERMTKLFHKHKYPILFVSKITNGLGLALVTLTTAGMVRIPFWKYMGANLLGQFIWSGFLLGIGFFFGDLYVQINNIFWKIGVVAAGLFVLFLLYRYQKYLRSKADAMDI